MKLVAASALLLASAGLCSAFLAPALAPGTLARPAASAPCPLLAPLGAGKDGKPEQEIKDLNLEEMFEVFEAADKASPDDGDNPFEAIQNLFGGGKK